LSQSTISTSSQRSAWIFARLECEHLPSARILPAGFFTHDAARSNAGARRTRMPRAMTLGVDQLLPRQRRQRFAPG